VAINLHHFKLDLLEITEIVLLNPLPPMMLDQLKASQSI
jgi:hypothetical protein